MTNKYAEGYPGRRYYGGCEFVDVAEELAIDRIKQLLGCAFANVQPHSGSHANFGVYQALLTPGDTLMGMSLDSGGHLSHGAKPNQSGKWFNAVQYGVRQQDGRIDYDAAAALAQETMPKIIVAGGSAYPREIDFENSEISRIPLARISWSIWRISRVSSQAAYTPARCRLPML